MEIRQKESEKRSMTCQLKYRLAVEEDSGWIYELSSEKSTRSNSLNTGSFSFEDHQSWFRHKLDDPNYHMLIYFHDERKIGILRLEQNGRSALVSIALSPDFRGSGFGLMILTCASEYAQSLKLVELKAQIWSENKASIHIFEKENYLFKDEVQLEDGRIFKEYIRLI